MSMDYRGKKERQKNKPDWTIKRLQKKQAMSAVRLLDCDSIVDNLIYNRKPCRV